MEKKRIIRNIILVVITALIVSLTATFAFWKKEVDQVESNFVKSLCMDVSLINEEDDILLEDAYPISDEEGLSLKPYKFTIKNNCETTAKYNINFELLNSTTLSDEYVAISLNGVKNGILNELDKTSTTIENALSSESGYSLEEGTLNGGEEKNFELRLWMDKSVTAEDEESMEKTLEGKITLIADYVPQLEINNTLTEWGLTDTISIHGYSRYHKIVAYSISEEKDTFNWKDIEGKKEIKIEEEIDHNGKYYVSIKDEVGGITTKEITIDKIDDVLPEIIEINIDKTWGTRKEIKVLAIDKESGIVAYQITKSFEPEKEWNEIEATTEEQTFTKEITENGEWYIHIKDKVGNVKTDSINVDSIDDEGPTITLENANDGVWTKEDVNVILNINETGSGIDYCEESTDDSEYTRIEEEASNSLTLTYTGNHNETRYYRCYDKVGNVGNTINTTLKIDQELPTIESVTKDIDTMTNQSVTITIKASDDVELDSKPYSFDGGESWIEENYKEYQYNDTNISIQVKDHVGNITTYDKEIIVDNIDKQGPTISNVETTPQGWTNTSVTIKVTASDDVKLASEAYSFDDGLHYQESNEMTYENNKSGIKIKVKDDVGNETSYDEEINITNIDHTEPSISGVSKSESNWTSGSVTLIINGAEDLGGSGLHDKDRYSFDGGVNWQLGSTKEYLANESNIVIKVQDNAGNIYTYEEVQSITNIDTDGPDIKSMNVSNEWEQTNEISTTVIDKDSGIAGYEYSTSETINNNNLTKQDNLTEEQTYKKNVDVNTKWYIHVKDQVGNVSSRNITVEKVDKDAPTIEVVNDKTSWTNEDVTVKINISNISSGSAFDYCEESTNDSDYTRMTESLSNNTISKTYTGNHNETRYYRCYDKANNRSLTKSTTLKIDQSLPSITGVKKSNSSWTNQSVTLTIEGATDSGGSNLHDSKRYSFDGGVTWQLSNKKEYKANESNITIKVQDNAGNIYTYPTKQEITNIEKELPSITGVKKSPDGWTNGTVTLTIEGASDSGGSKLHDTAAYSFNNGVDWQASASKGYSSNESDIVIKVRDNAGNIYTYPTAQSITNIEKELPSITGVSKSNSSWTKDNVTLTINGATDSGGSGLHDTSAYSFNNGTDWQSSNKKEYQANESNIIIKVRDNAGNIYTYPTAQSITNIDKEPPSVPTVNLNGYVSGTETYDDVKISLTSTDNQSVSYYEYSTNKSSTTKVPNNPWTIGDELNATYYFRAVDHVGNPSGWTGAYTINKKTGVDIAGTKIPLVESGDGLYKIEHNDLTELSSIWNKTEYRYAGVDPDNYVKFNNEIWRIIGLVNVKVGDSVEQRVKIVRTDGVNNQKVFGNYAWDKDVDYTNNWTTSKLKDMLNGIYYESSTGECYTGNNGSAASENTCDFNVGTDLPKGLDDTAREMIDKEVIWNIGGWSTSKITANQFYEKERGTNTYQNQYPSEWSNETEVGGKHNGIGLIYPSDYGYAVGGEVRNNCLTKNLYDYDRGNCKTNDWLKPNNYLWTLSPYSSRSNYAFVVNSSGDVNYGYSVYGALGVWPVGYLKTSTKIVDGSGEIGLPYILK